MHGLIAMNWLFLRSLSAFFSFNVRLLLVFWRELFIEPNSSFNTCEEAIQDAAVWGRGIQFDIFMIKSFGWVGTMDQVLVRTENYSLVKVWLERLWIMFWLYWEVYVLLINVGSSIRIVCMGKQLSWWVVYICVVMGWKLQGIILHCRLDSSTMVLLVKINVVYITFVSYLYW